MAFVEIKKKGIVDPKEIRINKHGFLDIPANFPGGKDFAKVLIDTEQGVCRVIFTDATDGYKVLKCSRRASLCFVQAVRAVKLKAGKKYNITKYSNSNSMLEFKLTDIKEVKG